MSCLSCRGKRGDAPFPPAVERRFFPDEKAGEEQSSVLRTTRRDPRAPVFIAFPETENDIRHLFQHPLRGTIHQIQCGFIIRLDKGVGVGEPVAEGQQTSV